MNNPESNKPAILPNSHPAGSPVVLEPARLLRDEHGTPWSGQYHDIYHARQGALAQAQHVFLRGNGLPQRWQGQGSCIRPSFTVCEAGFGLGRNFLALWQAWRADPHRCPRLHVLAFEAHPFSREDLAQANRDLPPALQPLAAQLTQAWPLLLPGLHRLEFEAGAVTLTLAFGPIVRMSRQVQAGADAFFLDGFAPRANPQMWTPELFGQLVRIANSEATLATWCVAGQVRRDLAAAGFLVSLAPGFGGKRQMLVAKLRPGLGHPPSSPSIASGRVLVVGAGIAGASIAHALALRGSDVTVADPLLAQGLGAAHAGHRAVAVTPVLAADDNPRARLARAGVLRALHRWQALPDGLFENGTRPRRCGAWVLPKKPAQAKRLQTALTRLKFPPEWVCWQSAERLAGKNLDGRIAHHGGLWFEQAQIVQPEALLQALLTHPNIHPWAQRVQRLTWDAARQHWRMMGEYGSGDEQMGVAVAGNETGNVAEKVPDTWQTVVLANASGVWPLLRASLKDRGVVAHLPKLATGRRTGGQVSDYRAHPHLPEANAILSGDGYWLPALDGCHTAGSTYLHDLDNQENDQESPQNFPLRAEVSTAGHVAIRAKLKNFLDVEEHHPAWQPAGGWAGWRAVVAGRLPVIGAVAGNIGTADPETDRQRLTLHTENLWLACAFGSRGFTWAALAGDIIAAALHGEPQILERDLIAAIAPR